MTRLWPAATDEGADEITRMPDQGIGSGASKPPSEIFAVRIVFETFDVEKGRNVKKRQNWLYRRASDAKEHYRSCQRIMEDPEGDIVEAELLVGGVDWFPMREDDR